MKVATFNLYNFNKVGTYHHERKSSTTYSDEQWNEKQTWVRAQLKSMNADVVGFQEVYSIDELKSLVTDLGYKHFETVEQTVLEDSVYPTSVNAIASRLPIKKAASVAFSDSVKQKLNLKDNSKFSRAPIKAVIDSQSALGDVVIYVAHLKSKRPIYNSDKTYEDDTPWKQRVIETMADLSSGNIAALLQRGAEATMLYHDFIKEIEQNNAKPVVVLGDLNDYMRSVALRALTMNGRIYEIGGIRLERDKHSFVKAMMYDYQLYDAFDFPEQNRARVRPFTYLYQNDASTLDYILVSNTFNHKNSDGAGKVTSYHVLNEHIFKTKDDGEVVSHKDKSKSDHGQVVIEITPRSEKNTQPKQPNLPPAPTQGISREQFIEMAGGVFQSSRKYKDWGGRQKRENFWDFFFNPEYGWVKSVYGAVPFDELQQKKRHSIEHIIPKSFLKTYLNKTGVSRNIKYGATVNPLNFAIAERRVNSNRSNFPFDMDGDKVVRPYRLDLNPESYGSYGLDADKEWVIPSRTRGDIARAILYMVLVYDINELYNQHIDELVHWAKVDLPTAWEIAFNDWVYSRLGIRNPLIADMETTLKLLNDKKLMQSVQLKP